MPESLTLTVDDLEPRQVAEVLEFVRNLRAEPSTTRSSTSDAWRSAESTGWMLSHVRFLRDRLTARGNDVQLRAFDAAIDNGGRISRDEVFHLGGYEPSRQLKNWTKPYRTVYSELVNEHELPESAELPMEADYIEGSGYRQAFGFSVAPEVVKLVRGSMCDACWKLKSTGTSGRKTPPHPDLEREGDVREMSSMGMRADEQDYRCTDCGKQWMHETGNHGMGWVGAGR